MTIRGAKMLGTGGIMANEVFVTRSSRSSPATSLCGLLRGADECRRAEDPVAKVV